MKMSKLSNQTNSQDPQAVNSRVFVGNLNTFQCSKTDVERMFQKYGRLAGISMHKGYAFVQFTNPFDARNACHGEDGRTVLSQILDVNMVAEPKPHQTGRKRQNLSKTGNDWDYYYDSYYASTLFTPTPPRPLKRQRLMGSQNRSSPIPNKILNSNITNQQQQIQQQPQVQQQISQPQLQSQPQQQIILSTSPVTNGNNLHFNLNGCNGINGDHVATTIANNISNGQHNILGPFKVYSNPDTLICGNCRECFTELSELLDHKKSYCKLRFICKCQSSAFSTSTNSNQQNNSPKLLCVVCKDAFKNPWDLMVHAQAAHMINIYELGNQDEHVNKGVNGNGLHINDKDDENMNGIETNGNGNHHENDLKDDNSSIHDSPYKDDHSITSNVHSSNENLLFEDQSSSSPTPSNDGSKHSGVDFITENCPSEDEGCSTAQACIVRTLSIDTAPAVVTSLSLVTNTLGLAIANGTLATQ